MHLGIALTFDRQTGKFAIVRPRGSAFVSLAHDPDPQLSVVLLGRLHYREEFAARFAHDSPTPSDAELILQALNQSGTQALAHLEGEFSVAIWDGKRRALVGVRDPLGSWPLFWQQDQRRLALATSLELLAGEAPINQEFVADYLMWPNPQDELPVEHTVRTGVQRVLPGTQVTLFADGRAQRQTLWDWTERIGPEQPLAAEAAAEQLQCLLRQAIQQRIGAGSTAAHCSGGMDSSAVICLAEQVKPDRNPLHLLALTCQRGGLQGERTFIDQVLQHVPGAIPHWLAGESSAPFDWFTEPLPKHDEPYGGLPGMVAERGLTRLGKQVGARTILTGLGSDEILASNPLLIADAIQNGHWWSAWRQAQDWGQAINKGSWSIFLHYGLQPLWPLVFREGCRWPFQSRAGQWSRQGWHSVPAWFSPEFARERQLAERGRAHARRKTQLPFTRESQLNNLRSAIGDWVRVNIAAPLNVNVAHPFRDPRLICAMLRVPLAVRSDPARRKPVLQEALRGVLPEAIRTRRAKRGFDDLYGLGLARNLPRLEELVQNSALVEAGLIQAKPLLTAMQQASLGMGDARACERVDTTLALIAWREMQDGSKNRSSSEALPPVA